jgi:hypothetical protein
MNEVLEARLKQLGINKYELAKRIAIARGDESKQRAIAYQASRVVEDPDSRRFASVREVVEALGGSIVIQWENVTEIKV